VRQLQILRCYHSKGWHPDLALEGREHLDAALGEGRGAILWVVPLAYASLVTKATLHRHGVPLAHLSRWYHGVSRSRWGVALFNSIQRRAEDRFLHERVTIGDGQSPLPALRRLRQHLAENRAVSITLGHEASDTVSVPFLDGALAVPVGPMKLATSTGAKLLPVHTFARGAGAFLTRIEPPLPTALAARVPFADVARELAARLERCALEAPGEFFWPGGLVIAAPSTDLPPVPVPA
jgi:lauroyl/myristoyl acyltransferase